MAERIAQLYAEIGADTTKLEAGLGKTKESLSDTKGWVGKLGSTFVSTFSTMMAASSQVEQVIGYVKDALDQTVGATVAYAEQVRDLARASGMGAEETSRLIQVADDLAVSYDTLKLSLRTATQQGITLSTEALAKLSDEYLTLAPGVERNEFLIKNFGRAGLEMAKVLEVGSGKLKEMAAGQADNLVLTEKAVIAARQYEMAMDSLNDSITGVKYAIGNELIPAINREIEANQLAMDDAKNRKSILGGETWIVLDLSDSYGKMADALIRARTAAMLASDAYSDAGVKAAGLTNAVDNTTMAVVGAKDAYWSYVDAMQGAGGSLNTVTLAQMEADDAATKLELSMRDLTKQMLFQMAAVGLDTEAQYALAESLGLIDEHSVQAQAGIAYYQNMLKTGQIDLETYNRLVKELGQRLGEIPPEINTAVNVKFNYTGTPFVPGDYSPASLGGGGSSNGSAFDPGTSWYPHADGGSFRIPPGYNETWPLGGGHTASSGEIVTVSPKEKTGGDVINISVSGANRSDEELAHVIARVIQRTR